nr:hypothetical protein [Butyrivibrio sp. AE3009]
MENIIYNELIYRGYNVDVGVVEIRVDENGKRTKKQLEVDFVVNQGSKRYYIQSAFALPDKEKMDQEQASLVKISDSFKKIIIVSGNAKIWRNEQGIMIIVPLRENPFRQVGDESLSFFAFCISQTSCIFSCVLQSAALQCTF